MEKHLSMNKQDQIVMTSEKYSQDNLQKYLLILGLFILLIVLILFSLSLGSTPLSFSEIFSGFFGDSEDRIRTVMFSLRLPRILTAAVVGCSLSISGCVMQIVLQNQIASSSTLGVSQGAAFGAAFAIVFFENIVTKGNSMTSYTVSSPITIIICAFVGGLVTTLIILALSKLAQIQAHSLVLAGVALSALFSAGTILMQYFADDVQLASIVYWTFGDLGRTSYSQIFFMFGLMILAWGYFYFNHWNYNALTNGDSVAKSLGVNTEFMITLSMFICALITSVSVALVGVIGFVGLIAPHITRKLLGSNFKFLILGSGIMGSLLLVVAELTSRMILSPVILPIGALTSFFGGLMFLYLILRRTN